MLPKYNDSNPSLLESIVCFTDILGFSALNKSLNLEESNFLLRDLHSNLKEQYQIMQRTNPNAHFKAFTDNIILAYPLYDEGEGWAGSIFMSFIDYQLYMTLKGYFLRGGISTGTYYGDKTIAYGPALIEAYKLESTIATSPRIILSPQMIRMVQVHIRYYAEVEISPQFNHILKDEDGIYFLNYLYQLHEEYNISEDFENYKNSILSHKILVERKLQEFQEDERIVNKYRWVAQYHNYYCREYFMEEIISNLNLIIDNISIRNFSRISLDDRIVDNLNVLS